MVKKILQTLVTVMVVAYLGLALTAFNRKPAGQTCKALHLVVKDSVNAGFITLPEITAMLQKKGISPIGRPMERILTRTIEQELARHPLIDEVECYKTLGQDICVEVTQRIPVLRVMAHNGENYYVDNKGNVMPPATKCVAHAVVATGFIEKSFATRDLYKFAVFLQQNPFWNAQIQQICVNHEHDVELVPRVGDHVIYMGKLENYGRKLDRLKAFYQKGLNQVGWNKYSRINVEFGNQVICTKN